MSQINSNNTNNYELNAKQYGLKPNFHAQPQPAPVQIPDMYYIPEEQNQPKGFKETIKSADLMGIISPWVEHPVLMGGTCVGLAYGVDKFSKACGGEYQTSLVGKAANLGDKIQESRFIQSDGFQKIYKGLKNGKDGLKNFLFKNSVIRAIFTTPSKPEWSAPLDEMITQEQRVAREFLEITDGLKLEDLLGITNSTSGSKPEGGFKLKNLGLTKEERAFAKTFADEGVAANNILLKRLGRTDAEISQILKSGTMGVKQEILKELGLTVGDLQAIREDSTGKLVSKVKEAANKGKGKVWIGKGEWNLGELSPFRRNIGCDEIFNRLHSMNGGAKTATGRAFSTFLQKVHRGFTFGGGKLGVLAFVSPMIVETILDTKKADKDQKIGTAAHGLIQSVAWVFTFPLALKIMHAFGGVQYAGMTKDDVEAVRNCKKTFNNTNFENEAAYKTALKKAKEFVKSKEHFEGQSLFTKTVRRLGKFMTLDLERFLSYRNGSFTGNTLRKTSGFFKNVVGVPMRLIIWGALTMGVLDGLINKGTKLAFGNYYDRMKEEEHEANLKNQEAFSKADLKQRLYEAQAAKQQGLETQLLNSDLSSQNSQKELNKYQTEETKNLDSDNSSENIPTNINQENSSSQNEIQNKRDEEIPAQNDVVNSNIVNQPPQPLQNAELNQNHQDNIDNMDNRDNYTYIPSPIVGKEVKDSTKSNKLDNYSYIPSQENQLGKEKQKELENKYIPSQRAANITKTFDNSGLDAALRRADRAEENAIKVLSGKFEN